MSSSHPLSLFRFCPECGSPHFVENDVKSKRCEDCGFTYYFNPAAATVALIERRSLTPGPSPKGDVRGWYDDSALQSGGAPLSFRRGAGGEAIEATETVEWLCVRRAKDPARGTLDLPGGFSDLDETSEEGVIREVKEETNLDIDRVEFLFSIPNRYVYSGFTVHTIDMFYRCHVKGSDTHAEAYNGARAADDAGELLWLRPEDIRPEDFGLLSIRRGVERLLRAYLAK